jgi:predicted enzyme related to lactoylglutathione lyase
MGRVVHFEIHCDDLDRAQAFYSAVFGWAITRWEGSPVDYRLITTGPGSEPGINGALVGRRGAIDGQAVIAYVNTIEVEDLEATDARIAASGGVRVVDRADIPGIGSVAYYKDSEGNIFAALQPAA